MSNVEYQLTDIANELARLRGSVEDLSGEFVESAKEFRQNNKAKLILVSSIEASLRKIANRGGNHDQ